MISHSGLLNISSVTPESEISLSVNDFTDAGISSFFRAVHPLKDSIPRLKILPGRVTSSSEVHPSNAYPVK